MNLSTLPITEADEDSRGGVHTIEWKEHGLKVTVSKLREQSNGDLRADFDLTCQPAVGMPDWFKYFTRFNLKSGQTKASTSRDLERVAPAQLGAEVAVWRYIIERVCNYVRVAFNEGEAGIQLIDSKASETTEFRLWPLALPTGTATDHHLRPRRLWQVLLCYSGRVPDCDRARAHGHATPEGQRRLPRL